MVINALEAWKCVAEVIFQKTDPIPGQATRRPVRAHEFVFVLAKDPKAYFYDAEAIKHPNSTGDGMTNARTVWAMSTESSKVAHGAVMPQGLIRKCLKAAVSEYGNCAECGAPYKRHVERKTIATRPGIANKFKQSSAKVGKRDTRRRVTETKTIGWHQSCTCKTARRVPATILDPFAGSGSTAVACKALGLNSVSIELYPEYSQLIKQRLREGK